jgi:YgiT-type zinc finger domain-containing protein
MILTRCPACLRATIVPKPVDRDYQVGRARKTVRRVPALVCTSCGATFLDLDAAAFVDRSLRRGRHRKTPAA